MDSNSGFITEIYSAIQGEGPLVGVRQIFVRFNVCDLRCKWCDTPESLEKTDLCRVETFAGSRKFEKIQNPINIEKLSLFILSLSPQIHHSISLTGGEPLLQADFLKTFLSLQKSFFSLPVLLETGGHRPDKLIEILPYIDYVSMDIKLPSSSFCRPLWDEHSKFLSICFSEKKLTDLWVKIVVTSLTSFDELKRAVNLVMDIVSKRKIEIFLQPVSPINDLHPPTPEEMILIQTKLLEFYPHIRVVPQVHKLIGQI